MNETRVDPDSFYLYFTRDAEGDAYCTVVHPKSGAQVRFGLPDLERVANSLEPGVSDAVRRTAPALPGGNRVGIMVKVPGAPDGLASGEVRLTEWDPAKGRFYEESSIPFDGLMLCVERGEHDWHYHAFAKQDRCTRCQVLKDGTYL